MRTIVHLSDLHFGRVDAQVAVALTRFVNGLAPHAVVVSGDLTQRAKPREMDEARAFLDELPQPQIVVPGNHDVPLWNVVKRVLDPLGEYQRRVTPSLRPVYADGEMAIVGVNTAHAFTIKGGYLSRGDLERVCESLRALPDRLVKIVVSHHPLPLSRARRFRLRRTDDERRHSASALAAAGTDVFLTGHMHASYAGHTAERYKLGGRSAIVVEAGTATSTRRRGEPNAFNVLRLDPEHVTVERFEWKGASDFECVETGRFEWAPNGKGWRPAASTPQETVTV